MQLRHEQPMLCYRFQFPKPKLIKHSEFDKTVAQIEKSAEEGRWNSSSQTHAKEMEDTCVICDMRWSCPAWKSTPFPMQYQ